MRVEKKKKTRVKIDWRLKSQRCMLYPVPDENIPFEFTQTERKEKKI